MFFKVFTQIAVKTRHEGGEHSIPGLGSWCSRLGYCGKEICHLLEVLSFQLQIDNVKIAKDRALNWKAASISIPRYYQNYEAVGTAP